MANFNVDTNGNLWIGSGVSDTFSTAQGQSNTKFYVTSAGAIYAVSGHIGGIVVDANGVESSNFNSATNTGWRLDNSTGIAQYFDIDIVLDGSLSDNPASGVTTLDFGNSQIYDFLGDLTLKGDNVRIQATDESANSPSLTFAQSYDNPGFYADDSTVGSAKLYWSNGNTNILHSDSTVDRLYIDASSISVSGQLGQANQFIGKDGSGNLGWHSVSGSSHPDSDHTSFLDQTDGDARYVKIVNQSAHGHNYDNYGSWSINGNSVSSGQGVTIQGQNDISVSTSGRTITIEHDDNDHNFSTGIVNISANGNASGSTVSFAPSGSTARFLSSINASGSSVTFNRTATTSASITTGTLTSADHFGSGRSLGNAGVRWAYIWLTNSPQVSSDERLKTDIVDLDYGLDFINDLAPKKFKMGNQTLYRCPESEMVFATNNGTEVCSTCQDDEEVDNCTLEEFTEAITDDDRYGFGFSAQDVNEVLDINTNKVVSHDDEKDVYTIGYEQLIAPLVKAVQELSTQISDLTARIEVLEG